MDDVDETQQARHAETWNSGQVRVGNIALPSGIRFIAEDTHEFKPAMEFLYRRASLLPSEQSPRIGIAFRQIQSVEADAIKGLSGIEVDGFCHVVDVYGIRHCIREHGDSYKEAMRGQIAIGRDDLILLPEVLQPANLVAAEWNKRKQLVLRYALQRRDKLIVATEIRLKRRLLALATMYKK